MPDIQVYAPKAFAGLARRSRYKAWWGGRGSGKSWQIARALIAKAYTEHTRIGCLREFQTSIQDSVHQVLKSQIHQMGLDHWFDVTQKTITSRTTGTEFLFKGLHHNVSEIKSLEGIKIAWVEEAQSVGKESWQVLIPTIREADSEIWATFNQRDDTDETYKRFVINPPPNAIITPVTWQDNPYFPKELNDERLYMQRTDPEAYEWIWGLATRQISDAMIFKGKCLIHAFTPPHDPPPRWFQGLDFGFSTDPMAFVRCYVTKEPDGEHLWIYEESYGHGVEFEQFDAFFSKCNGVKSWPIKADSARPETISYIKRKGYNCTAAEKWPGSVEDGITHLRGFAVIHIHERCKHMAQESRLYCYKVDRITGEVLPIVVDKNNHMWDAVRYALDGYIKKRGKQAVWESL